jgi:hypothetical protein
MNEEMSEEETTKFFVEDNIKSFELDTTYIVKVYRIYPAWADGQLEAIIKCKNEKEAKEVADYLQDMNIECKIEEVKKNTKEEILNRCVEDCFRLAKKHHDWKTLEIKSADEVLHEDERAKEEYKFWERHLRWW